MPKKNFIARSNARFLRSSKQVPYPLRANPDRVNPKDYTIIELASKINVHKIFANRLHECFHTEIKKATLIIQTGKQPASHFFQIDMNDEFCVDAVREFVQKLSEYHVNKRMVFEVAAEQRAGIVHGE